MKFYSAVLCEGLGLGLETKEPRSWSWSWSRDQSVKILVLVSSFLKRSWQQHWLSYDEVHIIIIRVHRLWRRRDVFYYVFRWSAKRSDADADEKRRRTRSETERRPTGPAAGNSGRTSRSLERAETGGDLTDQVAQERRHTETVISQQQATKRWYRTSNASLQRYASKPVIMFILCLRQSNHFTVTAKCWTGINRDTETRVKNKHELKCTSNAMRVT